MSCSLDGESYTWFLKFFLGRLGIREGVRLLPQGWRFMIGQREGYEAFHMMKKSNKLDFNRAKGSGCDGVSHWLRGLLGLVAVMVGVESGFAYTWTSSDGRKLTAEFVSLEANAIRVRATNGKILKLPFNHVIPDDLTAAKRFEVIGDDALIEIATKRVDAMLASRLKQAGVSDFNPEITDEQFVRRIYLDVIGRIPSFEEFRDFKDRTEPNKRDLLIDELLLNEASHYAFYNYFADMFRLNWSTYVSNGRAAIYMNWWREQLKQNTPYDEIIRELILAEGSMASNPASGYLLRDYGMELDAFSNFSQVFLGVDLSCAQCHDHPFEDWTQMDFFQMYAFFGQTQRTIAKGSPYRDEEWGKGLFEYAKGKGDAIEHNTNPAMWRYVREINLGIHENTDIDFVLPESFLGDGGRPGKRVKPLPLFGEAPKIAGNGKNREILAEWLLADSNPRFSLVIANRMWERAFGRALILPINDFGSVKESSQPEVLDFLGEQMKRVDYNLRAFMRILYRTRAYQSQPSSEEPEFSDDYLFAGPILRRMRAEQVWDSLMVTIAGTQVDGIVGEDGAFDRYVQSIDYTKDSYEEVFAKMELHKRKARGDLKPVDGSVLRVRGSNGEPFLESIPRMPNAAWLRTYRAGVYRSPNHQNGTLLPIFGESQREIIDDHNYNSSVPQALALMNHGLANYWTGYAANSIGKRVSDPADQVDQAFQVFLSRNPTPEERSTILKAMEDSGRKELSNVTWALLNSPEFLFIQ